MKMLENYSLVPKQSWLGWFYRGVLVLGAFILTARLFELQVIKGEYYKSLADGNRARRVTIQAQRGKILARDGELLADNQRMEKTVVFDPLQGYEKVDASSETSDEDVLYEWSRTYPMAGAGAHVVGFIGEINSEEVGKVDPDCQHKGIRTLSSYTGRTGLENYYDCHLRGIDGEEIVEVDTQGIKTRNIGRRNPVPGQDLHTTIDYKLQNKVTELMEGLPGAVIVSKPNNEILSIVSSPTFDPNGDMGEALVDERLPLFNRSIGGIYHPGSIFKMVTSIASFEESVIEADYEYTDTGVVTVDEYEYTNWYFTQYGGQEGVVDTVRALARSTDTFYYKLGEKMGVQRIIDWAERFGLKDLTGIDISGEVTGLIPSPEWKKAVKGERWFLGNTYHLSIGQGDLTVTPIAAHNIAQAIANNGYLCEPFLTNMKGEKCEYLNIGQESLSVIIEGMNQACDIGGTGTPLFDFEPDVACKTGTAETFEEDVTHAWFTVFAPIEDPEYVITVLAEKGGGGSDVAAPVAREILDFIYHP